MSSPPRARLTWDRLLGFFAHHETQADPQSLERAGRGRRNSSGLLVHVDSNSRTLFEQFNKKRFPRNPRDIYHVYFLLRQKLVEDLLMEILERAEYWLKTSTIRNDMIVVVERNNGQRYVTTPAIEGNGVRPVRKVIFTIKSHDQGWSDFVDHHGTYEYSWTWFEARVIKYSGVKGRGNARKERDKDEKGCEDERRNQEILARRLARHLDRRRFRHEDEDEEEEEEEEEEEDRDPLQLTCNVHAWRETRTHTIVCECNGTDERAKWVRKLRRGQKIAVVPMAKFPGWANHVMSVQIEVYTSALR